MRDYYDDDEGIRAYTPILQRFIILAAVIIAVPVVMWTITTFVRGYFAPPKTPTFQRMADAEPADTATLPAPVLPPPAPFASAQPAPAAAPLAQVADASPPAGDKRVALLEIRKPADAQPAAAPPAVVPAAAAPPPVSAAPVAAMPSATASPAPPAPPPAAAPSPPAIPNSPAAKLDSKSDNATATTGDRAIVWPNPQVNTPPTISTDTATASLPAAAAPSPPAASDSASDGLPAVKPIAGPVPLPRQRPNDVAMLQSAPATPVVAGAVPLPRARPADAPTAPPAPEAPATSHDAGLGSGNY